MFLELLYPSPNNVNHSAVQRPHTLMNYAKIESNHYSIIFFKDIYHTVTVELNRRLASL